MPSVFKARKSAKKWSYKVKLPDGRWRTYMGFTDKRATESRAEQHQTSIDRGEVGLLDPYAPHKQRLLSDHLSDYIADLKSLDRDAMHVDITEKRLKKLADLSGWAHIGDITPEHFSRWRQRPEIQKLAPKTRNEYLQTLQAFCRWAVRQGRIGRNPIESVQPVKINGDIRRQRRALTDAEVTRLLAVAGERRALYLVALTCGLRRSELSSLRWSDVKLAAPKPYLDVRPSTTKNGRRAILWLRDDVVAALNAMPEHAESDRVFSMVGKDFCERWFYRDLDAAGIPRLDKQGRRVDFHALRHTLATNLGRSGVSIRTAMEVMRHSDPRLTTQTYTDAAVLPTAEAVESLPRYDQPVAEVGIRTGTFDRLETATTSATKPHTLLCPEVHGDAHDVEEVGVAKTRMDIEHFNDHERTGGNNEDRGKNWGTRIRT